MKISAASFFAAIFLLAESMLFSQNSADRTTLAAMYGIDDGTVPERGRETLPDLLQGIWQADDRYIFFMPPKINNNAAINRSALTNDGAAQLVPSDVAVVLKTYYGWFYDRSAEPENFAEGAARFLCTATTADAERVTATVEPLQARPRYDENGNLIQYDSGAWELVFTYNGKSRTETRIPVAVIGNELYLDFMIKGGTDLLGGADGFSFMRADAADTLVGWWQGICRRESIRIAPYSRDTELKSYYVTSDGVYTLRYWETAMPYTNAYATFSDGDERFYVSKHIVSAGTVFSCVEGRRTLIRNVEKSETPLADYTLDSTGTILAFGKPFLTRMSEVSDATGLVAVIDEANSRRKPDPQPLFPPNDVNWHWDIIEMLESGNALVQELRARQRLFASSNGKEGRIDAIQASMYSTHLKLQDEALEIADEAKKRVDEGRTN